MKVNTPRVMIAGTGSGSGKTTLVCGILMALKKRKRKAATCKCGPDYIDPMFHSRVFGTPSINLDLFFAKEEEMKYFLWRNAKNTDITVIEGVMGYYDGLSMDSDKASSYDTANALDIPVILTVPCKGMAYSVVPFIKGMIEFRKDSKIKGIILNQVSPMTYPLLKQTIEKELNLPVLGYLPYQKEFTWKSRHLGLVMPEEIKQMQEELEQLGELTETCVDMEKLIELAGAAAPFTVEIPSKEAEYRGKFQGITIGVAYDEAFCFYYNDNWKLLEELGCRIVNFSPIHDKQIPKGIQGMILGGGYPELYAKELSENESMKQSIKNAVEEGMPCIAECGGFMYLQESMETEGKKYPMAGVIKSNSKNMGKLVRFGYITLYAAGENSYLLKGETIKAHEFHYFDSTENGKSCLAVKPSGKRKWECVHTEKNLFAGYPHLYFYSNVDFVCRFLKKCGKQEGALEERKA